MDEKESFFFTIAYWASIIVILVILAVVAYFGYLAWDFMSEVIFYTA